MFKKIVVAYDGSPESVRALRAGIALTKCLGADLCALTVDEGVPVYAHAGVNPETPLSEQEVVAYEAQRESYRERLQGQARTLAEAEEVTINTVVVAGREVEGILAYAVEKGCDLLMVGYHKHSSWQDRIWGSTTHSLHLAAPCSLLFVQ